MWKSLSVLFFLCFFFKAHDVDRQAILAELEQRLETARAAEVKRHVQSYREILIGLLGKYSNQIGVFDHEFVHLEEELLSKESGRYSDRRLIGKLDNGLICIHTYYYCETCMNEPIF